MANPKINDNPIFTDAVYQPILSNWFTSKPYGFRFTPKDSSKGAKIMYLPINPFNLNITTHFATSITPSVYGTVEEHSPVRYYDISIEGTTGIAPKYLEPADASSSIQSQSGRSAFAVKLNLGTGLLSKTINTLQNIFNDASIVLNGGKPGNPQTGVQLDQTGYIAFHNLYRFLLKYKKDVAESTDDRTSTAPPLVFFNYKDGNEYSVVIKNFTLRRDKDNPMLYFYSISMRGYDLKKVNSQDKSDANSSTDQILANLGLNGVKGSSFLSSAKAISSQSKEILASVANGTNQLGR